MTATQMARIISMTRKGWSDQGDGYLAKRGTTVRVMPDGGTIYLPTLEASPDKIREPVTHHLSRNT